MSEPVIKLPKKKSTKDKVLGKMKEIRGKDARWQEGKTFSLVYYAGDEVLELLKDAYNMFFSENGLNPTAFPSLKRFETEVVSMTASLFHSDKEVVGSMTTGGTESLLMACKTARQRARDKYPEIKEPEMILPDSAHPGFMKACHYFDIKPVFIPLTEDSRANVEEYKKAFTKNTILAVGSAASYPHGVIDPIEEMAPYALERDVLFHVDSCIGGMMLPFAKKLGYPIPKFDFEVPGVTSISVDLHKYGYAAKGASVVLYKNKEIRKHQFFIFTDWVTGGIYGSPTMTGTRAGGSIAAAWAVMKYMGEEGYLEIVDRVMKTTKKLIDGINAMDGIHVISDPDMSLLAMASEELDIYAIGDEMAPHGWVLDRQHMPPSIHLTVSNGHTMPGVADKFLSDLEEAVKKAKKLSLNKVTTSLLLKGAKGAAKVLPENLMSKLTALGSSMTGIKGDALPKRSAAMYGMMGSLPNRGDVKDLVQDFMDQLYTVPEDAIDEDNLDS